jgi:hypothetical protein
MKNRFKEKEVVIKTTHSVIPFVVGLLVISYYLVNNLAKNKR